MSAEPLAEQVSTEGGRRSWLSGEFTPRQTLWIAIALAVLACLPVLVARYPQMVDYAAHLARYHIMLDRAESPFLKAYYGFQWHLMGNLGADLLIWPFAKLFGIEAAGRIVVMLTVLSTGLGIIAVEWTLRRRIGVGTMLALCFVWSPAMLLGFLNFGLSLAGALFAFALWVRLEGKRWREPLFVPIGLGVWLCHVSGWGALGVMVFAYEWHREKSWRPFVAPWPLMAPFLTTLFAGEGTKELASYGTNALTYKWTIWKQAMKDQIEWLDYASAILIGAILFLSLCFRRLDGRLGWAAVAMLGLAVVMPRHIFGGDLVDARMIYTGLMVGCLALAWRTPRWLLLLAPLLFLGRLGLTTADWYRESQHTARLLTMIEDLPRGAKVASLVVTERSEWGYNPQEHVGAWSVVRLDALNNSNFALPKVHMITIKQGGPFYRDPYHRLLRFPGRPIELAKYGPAHEADWLWYIGRDDPVSLPEGAVIVKRAQGTFLAKLAKPPRDS